MNKVKSFYILKDTILKYLPLKSLLLLFKTNRRYRQLFNLYPSIYEFYCNIKSDFEPYNEHIENETLSYLVHFSRIQKHLSDNLLQEYFFRFLLSQKKMLVDYDNINFGSLLKYLNANCYSGTVIIKLGEPKLDLSIRPNIEIKGENIFIEIYFNIKWIDKEKKDNIEYIKMFLNEKIAEDSRGSVKKIQFGEYINLNEEKYEDFFFEEITLFPNALFNIQSNYFDDMGYWKDLDRFFKLKFIIEEKLENENEDEKNKDKNRSKNIIKENIDANINQNNNGYNYNINNRNINSISKYYKEKKLISKKIEEEKNKENEDNINNNMNKNKINNEIKSFSIKYKNSTNELLLNKNIDNINNINIINDNNITLMKDTIVQKNINNLNLIDNKIKNNINNNDDSIVNNNIEKKKEDFDINKIKINENIIINNEDNKNNIIDNEINIINEKEMDSQEDKILFEIKRLNQNILSIRELDNFILDLRKNKISIVDQFFKAYEDKSKDKNKNPPKLTLVNFTYEKEKEYFSELNGKINSLIIVQRIYRNTPYPFFISHQIHTLIALKLERINILEENLVTIINNNPSLEVFEIHKNYTGYIYGYDLALALSQLTNLKSLITEFFWYKENVPSFKTNIIINRQENEFFKFLTSKSLKYLSFSNETNIKIETLNKNLPNLISLCMEYSNILLEDKEKSNSVNFSITKNNQNNNNLRKSSGRLVTRRQIIKKMSAPLVEVNYLKDFNYTEEDHLFKKLRDLTIVKIDNSDEFFKKMVFFNKIENLYIDYYDKQFFETLVKYGHHFNNLDMLFICPDFSEKIKPVDSENFVKNIHCYKKLTFFEIGFYCINEELIDLLFNELTQLPLLQQLEIRVDISSEENKEMLQNKINELKNRKCNSKYLTITYTFNDKRFKR